MTSAAPGGPPRRGRRFESRLLLLALAGGAPTLLILLLIMIVEDYPVSVMLSLLVPLVIAWAAFAFAARNRVIYSLYTLSNLLEAIREGDFSLRGRRADPDDAMGSVVYEVNTLTQTLRDQRLAAAEASMLLTKVIAELDIAVFAFDSRQRLRLANRAAANLVNRELDRMEGVPAAALGLDDLVRDDGVHAEERDFPARSGRWEIRSSGFREGGLPHRLLVVTDLSRTLRAEERRAWQRLIRVMGHELNNSLAPIRSMATMLTDMLEREIRSPDWETDLATGLKVIADRSEALSRFVNAYSRLARLPSPRPRRFQLSELMQRMTLLDPDGRISLDEGPDVEVDADPDQLEQLLINLIKNALEAVDEEGNVRLGWGVDGDDLVLQVDDDGPGLASTENVFVPFFTTKPGGSGIGLVISRQIAEAHGGTLTLENRLGPSSGCSARVRMPLEAPLVDAPPASG